MPTIEIELCISAGDYSKRYRLPGVVIHARSRDGRRVRLPASALQQFLTHTGIVGCFRIHFDDDGRLSQVERC